MKKVLLFLILLFIPFMVSARNKCDLSVLANVKKMASNVNTSYYYKMDGDKVLFDITLTNITPDIYFVDKLTNKTYYYSDTNNGTITFSNYSSGTVKYLFYSNNNECINKKLIVKNVNLPYYNKYYNYPECSGNENIYVCKKWVKFEGTDNDFYKYLNKYKNSNNNTINEENVELNFFDKIVGYYIKFYYLLFPLTIGFVLGIIYLFKYVKNRRNRFDI